MKISNPIKIKIVPPKIAALFENLVPIFLPIASPAIQIKNVTTAIINAQTKAITALYSAIVSVKNSDSHFSFQIGN